MLHAFLVPLVVLIAVYVSYKLGFSKGLMQGHDEAKEWNKEARRLSAEMINKIKSKK